MARYAFKTFFTLARARAGGAQQLVSGFVTYLDLLKLQSAKEFVAKNGWHMGAHFDDYSDGETQWESDCPCSCAEEHLPPEWRMRARSARRVSEHSLVKKRAKRG